MLHIAFFHIVFLWDCVSCGLDVNQNQNIETWTAMTNQLTNENILSQTLFIIKLFILFYYYFTSN